MPQTKFHGCNNIKSYCPEVQKHSCMNEHGLVLSGKSSDGRRMETLELPDRLFFFASQFHGEFKNRPSNPDPEYYGFVKACLDKKLGKAKPEF